jgi:proteasome activator subunit 4
MYDERMLQFLARISELHVDPTASDPKRVKDIPDDERSENESRADFRKDDFDTKWSWSGLYKDVGIFSDREWNTIMTKCLASMGMTFGLTVHYCLLSTLTEIPLADAGSLTTGPSADNQASFEVGRLPKPTWRIR